MKNLCHFELCWLIKLYITSSLPSSRAASPNVDLYPALLPQKTHILLNILFFTFGVADDPSSPSILPKKLMWKTREYPMEREREMECREGTRVLLKEKKEWDTLETTLLAFVCLNMYLVLEQSPTRAHLSLPSFYLPPHLLQIIHCLSLSIKYLLNFVEF